MTASIWNPGGSVTPQADPNSQIASEEFTATAGQTVFVLTQFTYAAGGGALSVYINGTKQSASAITEVSNTTFHTGACEAGDLVEAVGNTEAVSGAAAEINAAASASAADISEAAALASEIAAAASAAAAAASYDSFDDVYLGAKAAAPTLDNDGNALQTGALYWNTVSSRLSIWTGAVWSIISASTTPQTLTDAATIAWDWSAGNAKVSLAANRTLGAPTNATDGQYCTLRVARTGSFSITAFNAVFKGVSSIVQSTTSGQFDHFVFRYDSATVKFELVGIRTNIGA
jgi:hypothetical protein